MTHVGQSSLASEHLHIVRLRNFKDSCEKTHLRLTRNVTDLFIVFPLYEILLFHFSKMHLNKRAHQNKSLFLKNIIQQY